MIKSDNIQSFVKYRKKYPIFIYDSFTYFINDNKLSISFKFVLDDDIIFNPSISISVPEFPQLRENTRLLLDNLIFNIGLIELISYWKATCSPTIIIKCGKLSDEQIDWWKDLYFNGLGEFFYLNSIKTGKDDFVTIISQGDTYRVPDNLNLNNEFIVPVGGGKDSAVTLQLLKDAGYAIHPLIVNPRGATIDTVEKAGLSFSDVITIDRSIDPLLLKLNDDGFLNGHTPFSAMLAFYTLAASAVTGSGNIALSNESSANEPTIPGTGINHQYSKSFEFERNFREYYTRYIYGGFNYFSFLRPLNELQIVTIFAKLKQYHKVFRSCNAGSKTNSWCGHCPKCLFTHIMLAAFEGEEYADSIIMANMLNDPSMIETFDELSGISEIKPFECVGTINDVQTAMTMIVQSSETNELSLLSKRFKEMMLPDPEDILHFENELDRISQLHEKDHFLDNDLLKILKEALR